jgi:hypothetical protein
VYHRGGVITPMQDQAPSWVQQYRDEKKVAQPGKFYFGFGYGADENGFATQAGPRNSKVTYPFKSPIDPGMTCDRQRSGQRLFDFNKDGIAMYGMMPDWWRDIQLVGGSGVTEDMARGAEAYLQMWERASGIPYGCKSGREHFTRVGLGRMRLRYDTARLLRRSGQPRVRGRRAWTWCARRKRNRDAKVVAALDRKGKVQLIGSTSIGHRALRIRTGVKARKLRGRARRVAKGIYIRKAGKRARFVYGVRKGRVSFTAVATRTAAKNRKSLRAYLKLAGLR